MKVYIYDYPDHAGKWIYKAYQQAWEAQGFEIVVIDSSKVISEIVEDKNEEYILMVPETAVSGERSIDLVERSYKTFLFVQPNHFPPPWGNHPNFRCLVSDYTIEQINNLANVHLWAFSDAVEGTQFYDKWKKVHCVPLAFDSISYKPIDNPKYNKLDVSFVGGWANNGFDEKRKIIIETFSAFKDSGLKCGFFVNKNLTHQQECDLLANSKITLNIHDAYQRILGHDTNERTFKSLGLNGALVTDSIGQLNRLFPDIETASDAQEMVRLVKQLLSLSESELTDIKQKNKQDILDNHCYTNRVEALLAL